MRWTHLGCAALGILLVLPSSLATGLTDVEGDVYYLQAGRVEGRIASDLGFVMRSGPTDDGLPELRQFLLRAPQLSIVTLRTYVDQPEGSPANLLGQVFDSPESTESEEVFAQVDLKLLRITNQWNFLLYQPAGGASRLSSLGPGAFSLSNAEPGRSLLHPEAPRSDRLDGYLAGADRTKDSQLRLRTQFLSTDASGTFNLVLYGATLRLTADNVVRDITSGRHTVSEAGPLGLVVPRDVNDVLLLRVHDGKFRLLHDGPGLDFYAPQFLVQGRVELEEATGTIAWADAADDLHRTALALDGSLWLTARGAPYASGAGTSHAPLHIAGRAVTVSAPGGFEASAALAAVAVGGAAAGLAFAPGARRLLFSLIGLFSMVGKGDALRHGARNHLIEHIRNNPGTTLSAAQRDLAMGWGTIGYHVGVLERLGFVVTKRVGGKRLLFVQGQSRLADPGVWSALQNPSVKRLLESLDGDALTATRAASVLGCTSQYAGRLLRRLTGLGLLQSDGPAHRARYAATSLLTELGQRAEQIPTPTGDWFARSSAAVEAPVAAVAMASTPGSAPMKL